MPPDVEITEAELVERFPYVRMDHDTKHLYRGWLARELRLNRCRDCGFWHNPPKPVCPRCWSSAVEPTPVSGRGCVHLLTWLHQGPPAPDVDYAAGPHPVASVELAEQAGLRFTTTVVDCPRERLEIGLAVELHWIERFGAPFPVFRPAEG